MTYLVPYLAIHGEQVVSKGFLKSIHCQRCIGGGIILGQILKPRGSTTMTFQQMLISHQRFDYSSWKNLEGKADQHHSFGTIEDMETYRMIALIPLEPRP